MLRKTLTFFAVVVGATIAGCKDTSVPVGTPGIVTVRAFVDADGSGDFTTGDVPIAGAVTLTAVDGTTRQANAGTDGVATFDDVTPGSYTATLAGTVPNGAVLATAQQSVAVMPFRGGTVSVEFRYVFNPGSVNGVLFRDNNSNGVFDPQTDTPAPGMTVDLFAGGSASGTPAATTATNSTGHFTFATVRPGSYTVRITAIPTIQIVDGATFPVEVTAAATVAPLVRFTGELLTPIINARQAAVGSTVAFIGVATANAALVGTNQLYVQDATAGILVFGAQTAGMVAGDTVRVIGVTSLFNGELEVQGASLSVTKVGTGPVPEPRVITAAQLVSHQFLGQLVRVQGVRVVSVATTGATSYNVNFKGDAPADTFQVRVGNTNLVPVASTFWQVGRKYDVTGLDGIFNNLAQLKPRAGTDITVGADAITIAEARGHLANDTVMVEGVVYAGTGVYTLANAANLSVYLQDATGGAQVFNVPAGSVYVPGDSLRVTGLVTFFNSEFEIARFSASSPLVIEKLGTGTIPLPRTISATDFASRAYDGQLVRVTGLTVTSVSAPNANGAYNVVTTTAGGPSITVRIDASSVGIVNTFWQVGTTYDVVGAALNFSTNGTTFTPEVKPRSPDDVVLAQTGLKTIAEARAVSNDTVTVEGVVGASRGTFRTDNAYIQDATGGVQIFNLPLSLSLAVGDFVRVHGKMTVFSGESEITNNVTPTDSIRVTKLGIGVPPVPQVVSGAQFLARTYEGRVVQLLDVTILTVGNASGTGTYTVTGTAPDGSAITIFMSAPVGAVPPPTTFTVGAHYDLSGIAVPFGTPSVAELKPRGAGDVVRR